LGICLSFCFAFAVAVAFAFLAVIPQGSASSFACAFAEKLAAKG